MIRRILLFSVWVTVATAAPMTYTVKGTGSGYWNSQPFTNAKFTFTFTSDTATIVHGTSCCAAVDSIPSGTTASVTVAGFPAAALTGDQAIFMNQSSLTAGIWHFNSPEFLTLTSREFSNRDLTTTIPEGNPVDDGSSFVYTTPFTLSTGGTLHFTSLQGVYYYQEPGNAGGQISTDSVTPNSSAPAVNTMQTFTAVVSDAAGANDIGGVNFLLEDFPGNAYACWLYFNARTNALSVYHNGNWGPPTPIGSAGSIVTGDYCTLDTRNVAVSASEDALSLNLPITITFADGHRWNIYLAGQNKEDLSSDYNLMGFVTPQSAQGQQNFALAISPRGGQSMVAGSSVDFAVTVTTTGCFHQPVTFSGNAIQSPGSSGPPLTFAFNPATLSGDGTTTMTVSSPSSAMEDYYTLKVTGTSQSITQTNSDSFVYVASEPPVITLTPTSSTGSTQKYTFAWRDNTALRSLNVLFAPSVDGRNACWISFNGGHVYLASDDGNSWTDAGYAGGGFPPYDDARVNASNGQCVIGGTGTQYSVDSGQGNGYRSGYHTLTLPVFFRPGVMSSATIFIDASNTAGLDSGYLAKGSWSAQ